MQLFTAHDFNITHCPLTGDYYFLPDAYIKRPWSLELGYTKL